MFITAENIRTGEIRTFLGKERILVPNSKQLTPSPSVSAHWEKVEDCLDLRKYSRFFYVSESDGVWKKGEDVRIPMAEPDSKETQNMELPAANIESYRVLGIFLDRE
ncbi:hypothetical protein LEP1GSC058_3195 [Leptospira fainei serovar Hurstbridge str. BUT 6]|uniref:Uncharacterized protein n=1 Tax=Leptospira fainei serovar Hurstbridge str. BUT 6 TaxID=1193011 RepID=S3UXS2_9LEPT|nr:hypothetical protein [Leptospira fainei]EPG74013.1 hypothetical protein LEP1GSC058_3195 [Leptospira fainei serovar Hurstbridge str. BUT 6]